MICVKCGGQSVFPAMNEAPDGACDYRKCMSCGMRWDPTKDVLDTVKRAFEEWQPDEQTDEAARHDEAETIDREIALDNVDEFDDLDEPIVSPLDLAMKDVLVRRGRKKKEKPAMPKFVSEAHRERWIAGQKLSRKLKREAAAGGTRLPKGKRGRPRKVSTETVDVPAIREPETLADPRPVVHYDGVLNVIDAAIVQRKAELHVLERTREILSME